MMIRFCPDDSTGIPVEHPDRGDRLHGLDKPHVNREGADAGSNITAHRVIIDSGLFQGNLTESIFDVCILPIGRRNKGQFAGQGIRPTQAVDLAAVRAAEQSQQQAITRGRIRGEILFQKIHALARTAAKDHTVHFSCFVIHTTVPLSVELIRGRSTPSSYESICKMVPQASGILKPCSSQYFCAAG